MLRPTEVVYVDHRESKKYRNRVYDNNESTVELVRNWKELEGIGRNGMAHDSIIHINSYNAMCSEQWYISTYLSNIEKCL